MITNFSAHQHLFRFQCLYFVWFLLFVGKNIEKEHEIRNEMRNGTTSTISNYNKIKTDYFLVRNDDKEIELSTVFIHRLGNLSFAHIESKQVLFSKVIFKRPLHQHIHKLPLFILSINCSSILLFYYYSYTSCFVNLAFQSPNIVTNLQIK